MQSYSRYDSIAAPTFLRREFTLRGAFMRVTDPKMAEFFFDAMARRHVAPFLARECTLREAAKEAKVTPQRMSYWINKMIALKVIKFVRFEKQGKHSAAVYRSTQDEFLIPLSVINYSMAIELQKAIQGARFEQLQRTIAKNFTERAKNAYMRLWRRDVGPFMRVENPVAADDYFGYTSEFRQLFLDKDELGALHRELRELAERWYKKSDQTKKHSATLYCGLVENPVPLSEL
jgi:hypothetical protein